MEILLVDDDRDNRAAGKLFLKNMALPDPQFTEAGDENEAAELIRTKRFDLIVMDMELSMGRKEGAELIRIARNGTPNKDTAIVGWSSARNYASAMQQAGADSFATKRYQNYVSPVDQLTAAVQKAVGAAKLRQPEQYAAFPDLPPEPPAAARIV